LGNQLALGPAGSTDGDAYATGLLTSIKARLMAGLPAILASIGGLTGGGAGGDGGSGAVVPVGGGGGGDSGPSGMTTALTALGIAGGVAVAGLLPLKLLFGTGGGGIGFMTGAHGVLMLGSALGGIAAAAAPALIGLGAFGLAAYGPVSDAYTAVQNLNNALASGSPTAIASAQTAMANLSPEAQIMAQGFQKSGAASPARTRGCGVAHEGGHRTGTKRAGTLSEGVLNQRMKSPSEMTTPLVGCEPFIISLRERGSSRHLALTSSRRRSTGTTREMSARCQRNSTRHPLTALARLRPPWVGSA